MFAGTQNSAIMPNIRIKAPVIKYGLRLPQRVRVRSEMYPNTGLSTASMIPYTA